MMKVVCAVLALLVIADADHEVDTCPESYTGIKKREERWTCNWDDKTAVCEKWESTCYCDSEMRGTSGYGIWDELGLIPDSGEGPTWNCYSKCSSSKSGSQYSEEVYTCDEAVASEIDSTGTYQTLSQLTAAQTTPANAVCVQIVTIDALGSPVAAP